MQQFEVEYKLLALVRFYVTLVTALYIALYHTLCRKDVWCGWRN
jgi:hypothetical protein